VIEPTYQSPDGAVTLYLGDCLAVLPTLAAGSLDCVVTDPPYAIPTMVASGRHNTSNLGDLSLIESVFRGLFIEWLRLIGDAGRVFIFCDGTSYPVLFRAMYGRMNTAVLVWDKGQIGMGREFRKSHELVLHGWQEKTPIFTDGIGRADVLTYSPIHNTRRQHPAEKPLSLICDLLRVCGPTILDPFMGSGTTAVACVQTGRRFIGIEIDPTYYAIAERRIRDAMAQLRLPMEATQ